MEKKRPYTPGRREFVARQREGQKEIMEKNKKWAEEELKKHEELKAMARRLKKLELVEQFRPVYKKVPYSWRKRKKEE